MNRSRNIVRCALALLIVTSSAAAAETYYVRASGNDLSDGLTPATAFRTIQKAVNMADGPGHTIVVGPGVYDEKVQIGTGAGMAAKSGVADDLNVLRADPSGAATGDMSGEVVIRGGASRDIGIEIKQRNYWLVQSFTFRGQGRFGIRSDTTTGLTISQCLFDRPVDYGIRCDQATDLRIERNTIVRDAGTGHGIHALGAGGGFIRISANRVTMEGDEYLSTPFARGEKPKGPKANHATNAYGILAGAGRNLPINAVIENNIVSDSYIGIYANGGVPGSSLKVASNTVVGCTFGLYAMAKKTATVELCDNIVAWCYQGVYADAKDALVTVDGLLEHEVAMNTLGKPPMVKKEEKGKKESKDSEPAKARPAPIPFVVLKGSILTGDPLFTDPAAGDFTPQAGSPAIDAATGSAGTATDFAGTARPQDGDRDGEALPDFGAVERPPGAGAIRRVVQWREVPRIVE